jgi:exodeoxyribonuclease VII large subunit
MFNQLARLSPSHQIDTYRQRLDEVSTRLSRAADTHLERKNLQLENLQQSLRSLSPKAVLQRGYAIVTRQSDGTIIKNAGQVSPQDIVDIQLSQGMLAAQILQSKQEKDHDGQN